MTCMDIKDIILSDKGDLHTLYDFTYTEFVK